jgi:hypothetical protein
VIRPLASRNVVCADAAVASRRAVNRAVSLIGRIQAGAAPSRRAPNRAGADQSVGNRSRQSRLS